MRYTIAGSCLLPCLFLALQLATVQTGYSKEYEHATGVPGSLKNSNKSLKMVQVEGYRIPKLAGHAFDTLELAIFDQGELKPIRHQFEETTHEGEVYFHYAQDTKSEPIKGTFNIFDLNDRLLFFRSDTGERLPEGYKDRRAILESIQIKGKDNGYVYVVKRSKPAFHDFPSLVKYDVNTGVIETPHYTLHLDPQNLLSWEDFYSAHYKSGHVTPLDTLKIRMTGGVMTRFTKIKLNKNNFSTKLLAINTGSIKTSVYAKTRVKVMGLPVLTMYVYYNFFPRHLTTQVKASLPDIYTKVLINPVMTMTMDGHNLWGSKIYSSIWPGTTFSVDGRLSKTEKRYRDKNVNDYSPWVFIDTEEPLQILSFFNLPDNLGLTVDLAYDDDRKLSEGPERFIGQSPNIGYRVNKLPRKRSFVFLSGLFFLNDIGTEDIEDFIDQLLKPEEVNVTH